jgi:hypothetical protein
MDGFIQVEWTDLDGNIRRLEKVETKTNNEIEKIMLECALILETEIKVVITEISGNNPKNDGSGKGALIDTGYMRMNIHSTVESLMNEFRGIVYSNTEYIKWLEDGTKNADGSTRIKAFKFLQKAYFRAKPKISKHMKRRFKQIGMI